jgi:hypothetical protein
MNPRLPARSKLSDIAPVEAMPARYRLEVEVETSLDVGTLAFPWWTFILGLVCAEWTFISQVHIACEKLGELSLLPMYVSELSLELFISRIDRGLAMLAIRHRLVEVEALRSVTGP